NRRKAPPGIRPGWAGKGLSAGSWRPAVPSSVPPATSTRPGRRRRTPPASRPPTTTPWSGAANRRSSSPGLHLKDREQGAQRKRGDDDRDDHSDHPDRGSLADAVALKGDEIEQERNVGRVLAGTAIGQHDDRVVCLDYKKRSQQRTELDKGPDQGQGDAPKSLKGVGAVDPRGFQDLRVLRLQAGEDDQHHERRPAPDLHRHHRRHWKPV